MLMSEAERSATRSPPPFGIEPSTGELSTHGRRGNPVPGHVHEPGEPLQVTATPVEPLLRLRQWMEATGMSIDDVVATPIVTTPIPLYPPAYPNAGAFGGDWKRWPGVKPEAMWHPLMWLPPRVAHRYLVPRRFEASHRDDEDLGDSPGPTTEPGTGDETPAAPIGDDGLEIESDDAWAVRVTMWALHSERLLESALRLQNGMAFGMPADPDDAYEIGYRNDIDMADLVPLPSKRAIDSAAAIAAFGRTSFGAMAPEEDEWWETLGEAVRSAETSEEPIATLGAPVEDMIGRLGLLVEDLMPLVEEAAELAGGAGPFSTIEDTDETNDDTGGDT